jgi:hypothetical protein
MRRIIIALALVIAVQAAFSGCILVDRDHDRREHHEEHHDHY